MKRTLIIETDNKTKYLCMFLLKYFEGHFGKQERSGCIQSNA